MKISVIYVDLSSGVVEPAAIDGLLREEKIISFRRKDEDWVRVGIDPVRGSDEKKYTGAERRFRQR